MPKSPQSPTNPIPSSEARSLPGRFQTFRTRPMPRTAIPKDGTQVLNPDSHPTAVLSSLSPPSAMRSVGGLNTLAICLNVHDRFPIAHDAQGAVEALVLRNKSGPRIDRLPRDIISRHRMKEKLRNEGRASTIFPQKARIVSTQRNCRHDSIPPCPIAGAAIPCRSVVVGRNAVNHDSFLQFRIRCTRPVGASRVP